MASPASYNCHRFLNTRNLQVNDGYDAGNYSSSSASFFKYLYSYYWCCCVQCFSQLSLMLTWNRFTMRSRHLDPCWFAFCGSRRRNYRQLVALGGEFRGGCPSLTPSLSLDRKVHSTSCPIDLNDSQMRCEQRKLGKSRGKLKWKGRRENKSHGGNQKHI